MKVEMIGVDKLIPYARNPRHVDVAAKRWQAFTGKQATLESRGQTFAAVVVDCGWAQP